MNDNKKQLCPNCKTGADSLKLDPNEPMVRIWNFITERLAQSMCLSKKINSIVKNIFLEVKSNGKQAAKHLCLIK